MATEAEHVKLMEVVREMIWNDAKVRQAYEVLRMRGFSADGAVTEIAMGYLWCLWEGSKTQHHHWPDVLREIRMGRSVSDLFHSSSGLFHNSQSSPIDLAAFPKPRRTV